MNKEIERYEGELRELRERVKELEARLNVMSLMKKELLSEFFFIDYNDFPKEKGT